MPAREPEPEPQQSPCNTLEINGKQFTAPSNYGQPGDHRYTFPDDRLPLDAALILKTRDDYAAAGATLYKAHAEAYRTHADDTDPIVCTFDNVLTPDDIAHVIETALPKLRRAGVTTDTGTGGRQSNGRTNSLAWLPHDTTPTVFSVISKVRIFKFKMMSFVSKMMSFA